MLMAKINRQAIMQKLIDELNLYPGKDVIPSELAEKIIAVYQINTETIKVTPITANVVKYAIATGAIARTLYTTPATGKFYLTNATLNYSVDSVGTPGAGTIDLDVIIGGVTVQILGFNNSVTTTETNSTSINLQNPVLLDPGTAIVLTNAITDFVKSVATIVGYTTD